MVGRHEQEAIEKRLLVLLEPVLRQEGCFLVDVTFRREPSGWVVRLYADRPGGITVGDCAALSRRIGDLLEAKELIPGQYTLEVSSPGMDRVLKHERDFKWAQGKKVQVWKKRTRKGEKDWIGRLLEYHGDAITLEIDGAPETIPLEQISKVRLFVEV